MFLEDAQTSKDCFLVMFLEKILFQRHSQNSESYLVLNIISALRGNVQFQLQEVVTAIRKMRKHKPKYYNDLLMDQAELKTRATKGDLNKIFNNIVKLFNTIEEKVAGVTKAGGSDVSFRWVLQQRIV